MDRPHQEREWFSMIASITFNANHFDLTSKCQQLYIARHDNSVNMYLDSIYIILSSPENFPDFYTPSYTVMTPPSMTTTRPPAAATSTLGA
eukprot:593078-Ditylum_brightwellii.AAC.1